MPPFVTLAGGGYLMSALMEVGPVITTGLGAHPIDWLHLDAYMRRTSVITEDWEAQLVVKMSAAFFEGLHEGEDPFSIMPIEREI